jgi:Protein of unknown function (DUF2800)
VTAEMADAVQVYVDAARPYTELEDHLIEATVAAPIENCFGTPDFAAYDPIARRLTVIDFKYGQGVIVEVTGNKQLLTYAAGLLPGCDAVDEVELVVVQPRRPHRDGPVRQWIHTPQELEAHVAAARRAAALIERDPPILNAGDHCKFCRAASFCPGFSRRHTKRSGPRTIAFNRSGNGDGNYEQVQGPEYQRRQQTRRNCGR